MSTVAEAEQGMIETCVALADVGEVAIQTEGNTDARKQHGIELHVDRCTECVCRPPHAEHEHIQQDFRAGRANVREMELEE